MNQAEREHAKTKCGRRHTKKAKTFRRRNQERRKADYSESPARVSRIELRRRRESDGQLELDMRTQTDRDRQSAVFD